jgi:cysteine desulfurase
VKAGPIYLDYHATTPVDPRVLNAMLPYFTENFGNPASKNHSYGNDAFAAVEEARDLLARSIKAKSQEIVFTSGATEAINLAIKGVAAAGGERCQHFVTVATEHKAVLDCFQAVSRTGHEVTVLPVASDGLVDVELFRSTLRPNTVMAAVMTANNEIGVVQPIHELGKICREAGVYFFTDATQALGKIPLDVQSSQVDLLAASAHKVYGPKGIGMLYVRRSNPRVKINAIIDGGGHERGLRSGTIATPNVVGFAKALEIALRERSAEVERTLKLKLALEKSLLDGIAGARVNGHTVKRLAGNLNITLPGVDSEALMIAVKDLVAMSSGSACTTAAVLPSHVLQALGCSPDGIRSSVRIGIGRFTSSEDIRSASSALLEAHARLRDMRLATA